MRGNIVSSNSFLKPCVMWNSWLIERKTYERNKVNKELNDGICASSNAINKLA